MEKFLKRKPAPEFEELAQSTPLAPSSKKNSMWKIFLQILDRDIKSQVIIQMTILKSEEHICRKVLVNQEIMIFLKPKCGSSFCRFNPDGFDEFGNWLKYGISKDAVFCLYCYLMKSDVRCNDAFLTEGFSNLRKKERLQLHVGNHDSAHNQAWRKFQALMNQKQYIERKHSEQLKKDYQIAMIATTDCMKFLLRQGIASCGHDELEDSRNQGNFLDLLQFLGKHNEGIDYLLKNARENLKLVAPKIQKYIIRAAACETTKAIIDDLGDDMFAILIYEARDIYLKRQMAVCLCYVTREGHIIEHFLGLVHVFDASALSLKSTLESLFAKYNLSLARIRGQGYDGTSNMQDEFNELRSLILKESG